MINQVIAQIATWVLGILTAGGGVAVIAYKLFQHFGRSWLDQHFKIQLEELKQAKAMEIEHLKYEINSLFSRVSKIHDKEFELLPETWFKVIEAYGLVFLALDLTLRSYPDFERISDEQMEEYLGAALLADSDKTALRRLDRSKRGTFFNKALTDKYLELADIHLRKLKPFNSE
jgi:hypothetical protein